MSAYLRSGNLAAATGIAKELAPYQRLEDGERGARQPAVG